MSKYVLIPDSFKGTMSSAEICRIAAEEIRVLQPDACICAIPVADGGEGTVDAFLTAVGGHRVEVPCKGPYMEDLMGFYGVLPDGIAVVEMAAAAGFPMVGENRNAEATTTYGVGQLIAHAVRNGAKQIVLGLGGSATNDGGCGAAAALGVDFYNASGETFVPVGATLKDIVRISADRIDPALKKIPCMTMCDIDNPLCGPTGASAVFGPQKGADPEMVERLDAGLRHLAEIIEHDLGCSILDMPGSGAAGGFGGDSAAFFNSQLRMGIDIVLDMTNFDMQAREADLVTTGEGKLDSQSLRGKVVIGVARHAKALGVPVAALVGASEIAIETAYREGVSGVFPINPAPQPFEVVRQHCEENLRFTARNLIRFAQTIKSI